MIALSKVATYIQLSTVCKNIECIKSWDKIRLKDEIIDQFCFAYKN